MHEYEIYTTIGEEGFQRLVRGFYARIPTDTVLGPMYPDGDFEAAEQRLRDFLVGRFGGPPRYVEARGHPRLRMRHMPFAINGLARDRWLEHMGASLDEAELPADVTQFLRDFFAHVANFLVNRGQ